MQSLLGSVQQQNKFHADVKVKMSLHNLDLWNQVIYDLNGSCESLEQVLANNEAEQLFDYMPFLEYLDGEIFLCDGCGWWHEISEMADDEDSPGICEHCAN